MASTETKISKQGAAGTVWDITLTILETLEIARKPGVFRDNRVNNLFRISRMNKSWVF